MEVSALQAEAHRNSVEKGFWETPTNFNTPCHVTKLALIACEVAETIEALRKGATNAEIAEELADIVIRTADFAGGFGLNLEKAISEKLIKNQKREYRHGKQF